MVECHLPEVHAYAEDMQLYIAFKPEPDHATNTVAAMQVWLTDIWKWMQMENGHIILVHVKIALDGAQSQFLFTFRLHCRS